jgi:hypothetical protein
LFSSKINFLGANLHYDFNHCINNVNDKKNDFSNMIFICCPYVLPSKYKCQMIKFNVQIYDPFHINGFVSAIHQLIEMFEGISPKPRCLIKIHLEEICLTYGNCCNEIANKDILKLYKFDEKMNYNQHRH